jgi:hypothetical protein
MLRYTIDKCNVIDGINKEFFFRLPNLANSLCLNTDNHREQPRVGVRLPGDIFDHRGVAFVIASNKFRRTVFVVTATLLLAILGVVPDVNCAVITS